MCPTIPPYTLLIAHRGNSGPYPENTSLAIEKAIELGVDLVEVDVSLSRDGVPVLVHGPGLSRNTDGHGHVRDFTATELKRLDAGSWKGTGFAGERILSLAEALDQARHRVPVNLDLKTSEATLPALRVVQDLGMRQGVIITGCTPACVAALQAAEPRLYVLLNMDKMLVNLAYAGRIDELQQHYLAQARKIDPDGLNLDHRLVNEQFVEAAHAAGLSIWTWTVDHLPRLEELIQIGVDSVSTNWPERMMGIIRRNRGLSG